MTRCQKNCINCILTQCQKGFYMKVSSVVDVRKAEIVKACRELYQKMNFKEITIKEISEYTSFSRPSIYNYFPTKESIFLEIFREEYVFWCDDLNNIMAKNKQLTARQFAAKLAKTLEKRAVLLKLLSMNLYDLEENCTLADLTEFKKEYKHALETIAKLLRTYFSGMTATEIERFTYIFFPSMFGLFPYTSVTEKQAKAMNNVGLKYPQKSVYDFAYQTILTLLSGLKK